MQRKEPKDNPTLYVRERLDYSACVWEITFLVGIFLINLRQTLWMVFYQEKIRDLSREQKSSEQFVWLNRRYGETETQLSRWAITPSMRADSSQDEVI